MSLKTSDPGRAGMGATGPGQDVNGVGEGLSRGGWSGRRGMPARRPELAPGMTTVGLIGSGNIGGTVARLAVAAGDGVGPRNPRGPGTPQGPGDEPRPGAPARTPGEAARGGGPGVA